jgi:hypothetical protein
VAFTFRFIELPFLQHRTVRRSVHSRSRAHDQGLNIRPCPLLRYEAARSTQSGTAG